MKKLKEFMNTPWTWGTYFKMCGASFVLSAVGSAAFYAWAKAQEKKYLQELEDIKRAKESSEEIANMVDELNDLMNNSINEAIEKGLTK